MTNPTPEQMLGLAKICEPDKRWELSPDGSVVNEFHRYYDPTKESFTANYELMQVVFTVARECKTINQVTKLHDLLEMRNAIGILNLAIEVLL